MNNQVSHPSHTAPWWLQYELKYPIGKGVRIAVIDSGWDRTLAHPQVLTGAAFISADNHLASPATTDDQDRIGHGTACIDLIFQVAAGAQVIPVRIFNDRLETSVTILQAAIKWAVNEGVDIINLSVGTFLTEAILPLYANCEAARHAGSIIVAAQNTVDTPSYPAVFDNVISVGAAGFSNPYHFHYQPDTAVECLAKGGMQQVRWLGGDTITTKGTSFSAPYITGIVALLRERYPDADLEQIRKLLNRYAINRYGPQANIVTTSRASRK